MSRDQIKRVIEHLQNAYDVLKLTPESYQRDNALKEIQAAHQSVSFLALVKGA